MKVIDGHNYYNLTDAKAKGLTGGQIQLLRDNGNIRVMVIHKITYYRAEDVDAMATAVKDGRMPKKNPITERSYADPVLGFNILRQSQIVHKNYHSGYVGKNTLRCATKALNYLAKRMMKNDKVGLALAEELQPIISTDLILAADFLTSASNRH